MYEHDRTAAGTRPRPGGDRAARGASPDEPEDAMNTPEEGQDVQVRIGSGAWQSATYRHGQFVDAFGLPLDPQRISEWQATEPRVRDTRDRLAEWNALGSFH